MMFNFLDKIGSAKANLDLGLAVLKTMLESLKPYADKPFVELIIGKSCKDIKFIPNPNKHFKHNYSN